MSKNKFHLKKNDLILLAVLLCAALLFGAAALWQAHGSAATAVISVDGTEVLRLALAQEPDRTFSLQQAYGVPVSFEIKNHKIRFVNVTCPDHLCENVGFVASPGEMAVCMPNKTALVVKGN